MQTVVLIFVIVACYSLSHAFSPHSRYKKTSFLQMKSGGGYRKMLKKAKANGPKKQEAPDARNAPNAFDSPVTSRATAVPASSQDAFGNKQAWEYNTEGLSVKAKQEFKNKVPFSDDIYATIKTAVSLLSARSSKEKTLLTQDEADWLVDAVEVILEDANRYGPPKPPPRVEITKEEREAMQ